MVKKIRIRDVGDFEIQKDYLHINSRPRLKTYDKGKYKEVQFNSFVDYINPTYQPGYDYEGGEIFIMVLSEEL